MNLDLDGTISQISREAYDSLTERINWSRLHHIEKSPAHFLEVWNNQPEDTDPKKLGRATHVATFEPERYAKQYVVWGDRRAGKLWESFKAEHESFGREILTENMDTVARAIADKVRSNAIAKPYLISGAGEQSMLWTLTAPALGAVDGYTFKCKGRVDFISMAGAILDLKSTRDASPVNFPRQVMSFGYHGQAAFYSDGYHAITGKRLPYLIVAVESKAPFAVTVFRVPEHILDLGRTKYRSMLDRLALCRATKHWPEYADQEVELELPEWAMPSSEDDPDGLGLEF